MLFTTVGFSILIANIAPSEGVSNTIAMPKRVPREQQSSMRRPSSPKPFPLPKSKKVTTTSAAPLQVRRKAPHLQHMKERSKYRSSQPVLVQTEENGIKSVDKKDPNCGKAKDAPTKYVFRIKAVLKERLD